jgi:hypothetical protein
LLIFIHWNYSTGMRIVEKIQTWSVSPTYQ